MDLRHHTVLFVDDEVNILHSLQRLFRKEGYNILTASGGAEGLELLKTNGVSLVVSDNRMPEMDGVEFLSRVRGLSPETMRFMLTGYADLKAVVGAINRGEVSRYITKPWNDEELRLSVREALEKCELKLQNSKLLDLTRKQNAELSDLNKNLEAKVEEKTEKIRENFFSFVRIFADLMELYDPSTGGHSKRVASISKDLARRMGLEPNEAGLIEAAALLHSVGLVGVPKNLLEKDEDGLKESERAILRHSPVLTQSLFSSIDTLRQAGVLIRSHMERYDGKGYPDKLRKEEIPLGARIIAVCKLYDGLRHRKNGALFRNDAIGLVKREGGACLDPDVVRAFVELMEGNADEAEGMRVPVSELRKGMTLVDNIVTAKGRLLASKGTLLTQELIEKIQNFNNIDPVVDRVSVSLAA